VDIVESNNFLVSNLRQFFSNIASSPNINETLKRRGERFKENVTERFKWDFVEPEDEAPVVVEI